MQVTDRGKFLVAKHVFVNACDRTGCNFEPCLNSCLTEIISQNVWKDFKPLSLLLEVGGSQTKNSRGLQM